MTTTHATPGGELELECPDEELVETCIALATRSLDAPRSFGRFVELLGKRTAYFKAGPLKRHARVRHAMRGWFLGELPSRVNEYRNLHWLREHGLGAPKPLAAGAVRRMGSVVFQFLFTEKVEHAQDFDRDFEGQSPQERSRLAREIGGEVGRMHRRRFMHGDLFPRNVLVQRAPGDRPRILFLDAWRAGPDSIRRGPDYDVACFLLFGTSLLSEAEQVEFLSAYFDSTSFNCDRVAWIGAVARTRRRLARSVRRRGTRPRQPVAPSIDWSIGPICEALRG